MVYRTGSLHVYSCRREVQALSIGNWLGWRWEMRRVGVPNGPPREENAGPRVQSSPIARRLRWQTYHNTTRRHKPEDPDFNLLNGRDGAKI